MPDAGKKRAEQIHIGIVLEHILATGLQRLSVAVGVGIERGSILCEFPVQIIIKYIHPFLLIKIKTAYQHK